MDGPLGCTCGEDRHRGGSVCEVGRYVQGNGMVVVCGYNQWEFQRLEYELDSRLAIFMY